MANKWNGIIVGEVATTYSSTPADIGSITVPSSPAALSISVGERLYLPKGKYYISYNAMPLMSGSSSDVIYTALWRYGASAIISDTYIGTSAGTSGTYRIAASSSAIYTVTDDYEYIGISAETGGDPSAVTVSFVFLRLSAIKLS